MADTLLDYLTQAGRAVGVGLGFPMSAPQAPQVRTRAVPVRIPRKDETLEEATRAPINNQNIRAAAPPSLLQSMLNSASEEIEHYSPSALLTRALASRIPSTESYVGTPGADNSQAAQIERRKVQVRQGERDYREQQAGRNEDISRQDDIATRRARMAARFVGGAAGGAVSDPTSIIAPGSTLLRRVGSQALVSGLTDAAIQGGELGEGVRDDYDPMQSIISAAAGGVLPVVGEVAGRGLKKLRGSKPDVSPEELQVTRELIEEPITPAYDQRKAEAQKARLDDITSRIEGAPPLPEGSNTARGAESNLTMPKGDVKDVTIRDEDGLRALLAERGIQPPGEPRTAPPEAPVAPTPTERPEAPADPDFVGSINVPNLKIDENPEAAFRTLGDAAGVQKEYRSREDTQAAADALSEVNDIGDISATLKAGKDAVSRGATDLIDKAKTHGVDSPEYIESVKELAKISDTHSRNAGETGRGLNILGDPGNKTNARGEVEGASDKDLARLVKMATDPATADKFRRLLEKHRDDPDAVKNIIKAARDPKAEDYLFSLWYNMVLSGPWTHLKNIAGNTLNLGYDLGTHGLAAGLGQARRFNGGYRAKEADRVLGREFVSRLNGMIQGVGQGFANMPKAFKEGVPLDLVNRVETPSAFTGRKTYALEAPTRALAAEDEFFRSVAHMSELYGSAYRKAYQEGLTGKALKARQAELIKNPTPEMLTKAADYSQLMRFQDEPGAFAAGIMKMTHATERDQVGRRLAKGTARLFIPFVRTPSSIIRTTIRNSPLGVFESRNLQAWKKGGAERDLAIARVATGTAVTAYLTNLVATGDLTGDGPSDYKRNAEWQAADRKPRSIKIGGKWYPYDGFGPVSAILNSVANSVEQYKEGKIAGKDYGHITGKIGVGIADAMMANGWTESLANVFKIVSGTESQREVALDNLAAGMVSSMTVPSLIRQLNTSFGDTAVRNTKGDGSMSDRIQGRIQSGFPSVPSIGLQGSSTLPQKNDVYGDPISRQLAADAEESPAVKELQRLADESPDGKFLVSPAPTSIRVPGVGNYRLSAREYENYQALSGGYIKQSVESLQQDPMWKDVPDDNKRAIVKDLMKEGRAFARKQFLEEVPAETGSVPAKPPAVKAEPEASEEGTFTAGIPTSIRRTRAGNKRVHGASNSDHLRGDGVDFVPARGISMKELEKQARAFFGDSARFIKNEGDHVHVSIPGLGGPLYGKQGSV